MKTPESEHRKIWKYSLGPLKLLLETPRHLVAPFLARIVDCALVDGDVFVWFLVWPGIKEMEVTEYRAFATGEDIPTLFSEHIMKNVEAVR